MKNTFNKIKVAIFSIWTAITSIPLKSLGQWMDPDLHQTFYWVMSPDMITSTSSPEPVYTLTNIIRLSQILLGTIVFVIWIVNLIKIRKIDDKALKQNKIKRTGILVLIAIVVIFLLSLSVRLIKKYTA